MLDCILHEGLHEQRRDRQFEQRLLGTNPQNWRVDRTDRLYIYIIAHMIELQAQRYEIEVILENIADMPREREDHLLEFVVLLLLGKGIDALQTIQEEVRANLQLQIPKLRLLRIDLMFVRLDAKALDLSHHLIEGLAHLPKLSDLSLGRHLCFQVASPNPRHRTGQVCNRQDNQTIRPIDQ